MSTLIKQIPLEPGVQLMGLEKYGLSCFPGVTSSFEIPIRNGRYNIGRGDEKYESKLKEFEEKLGFSFDSMEGQTWLENFTIDLSHDVEAIDRSVLEKDFMLHVLEVNKGYGIIAMSEDDIHDAAINTFKFAVTSKEKEIEKRVSKKEIRYQAAGILRDLYESKNNRIILIAKYLLAVGNGLDNNKTEAFDKLSDYIELSLSNAEKFIEVSKLEIEYIIAVVKVKEAIFRGIISLGQDGVFYNRMSNTKYGRTESEVIEFLLMPSNLPELGEDLKDDMPYSISAQLKTLGMSLKK